MTSQKATTINGSTLTPDILNMQDGIASLVTGVDGQTETEIAWIPFAKRRVIVDVDLARMYGILNGDRSREISRPYCHNENFFITTDFRYENVLSLSNS